MKQTSLDTIFERLHFRNRKLDEQLTHCLKEHSISGRAWTTLPQLVEAIEKPILERIQNHIKQMPKPPTIPWEEISSPTLAEASQRTNAVLRRI